MSNREEIRNKIERVFFKKIGDKHTARELAKNILRGAIAGGEIENISLAEWLENRLKPNLVWLNRDDYARALIRSLWLAPKFTATDFGVRRRDFAQIWTDTARGFLGEIAFKKLMKKFNVEVELERRRGSIAVSYTHLTLPTTERV